MENNGWILTSKAMPGKEYEDREILVFTDTYFYDIDYFYNDHWTHYDNDKIIAWKPIEEFDIKCIKNK